MAQQAAAATTLAVAAQAATVFTVLAAAALAVAPTEQPEVQAATAAMVSSESLCGTENERSRNRQRGWQGRDLRAA
jgi:hypothetical protein